MCFICNLTFIDGLVNCIVFSYVDMLIKDSCVGYIVIDQESYLCNLKIVGK